MQKLLRSFVNFFTPESFKGDHEKRRYAFEIVVCNLLFFTAILSIAGSHYFVGMEETSLGPIVLSFWSLFCFIPMFILKYKASIPTAAHMTMVVVMIPTAWYMLGYENIVPPQIGWIALIPGLALFLAGRKIYLFWLIVCSVVMVSGLWFSATELPVDRMYFPHIKEEYRFTDFVMASMTLLIAAAVVFYAVDSERDRAEDELIEAKSTVEDALSQLQRAQKQMVEQEKLASLGGLVAGVAHEINTPVGNALTASSWLADNRVEVEKKFAENKLKKADLESYLNTSRESIDIIITNINRAAHLIQSFKKISSDQSSDDIHKFYLKRYLEEVMVSLQPTLRRGKFEVIIECPEDLELKSNAGAFSQILTNFITNSVTHAYDEQAEGTMKVEVTQNTPNSLTMVYSDDGRGIPEENISKIFDPFYTTGRGQGSTGLGLNMIFNLVTHVLNGQLSVDSHVGEGTSFTIYLPEKDISPVPKKLS